MSVTVVLLLFLLPAGISIAQVEVELRHGGTLEGEIVASDDSTITLRVHPDSGAPRDAVFRRSDVTSVRGDVTGENISVQEGDGEDDSYRNQLSAGLILYWQPGHYSDNRRGQWDLGYEHTFTPLVHDDEHRTAASRFVIPTSYISVGMTSGPLGPNTDAKSTEQLFGGFLVTPRLAVGAGVLHAVEHRKRTVLFRYIPEIIEQYAFAGRVDIFTSECVRLREIVAVGTVKQLRDWGVIVDVDNWFLFRAEHRLDYAIDREQAYVHEVGFQYVEERGSILRVDNSYEYAFSQHLSIAPKLLLRFRFPYGGKMTTIVGAALGLACYPSSTWMIVLRSGYLNEIGKSETAAFNAGVLVGWRF